MNEMRHSHLYFITRVQVKGKSSMMIMFCEGVQLWLVFKVYVACEGDMR